jgi:hypothetical protein
LIQPIQLAYVDLTLGTWNLEAHHKHSFLSLQKPRQPSNIFQFNKANFHEIYTLLLASAGIDRNSWMGTVMSFLSSPHLLKHQRPWVGNSPRGRVAALAPMARFQPDHM